MWKKSTALLITLLLLLTLLGVTAVQAAGNNAGPVGQIQPLGPQATRLSDLPLALQYKVSEAMGRNQSGYHLERQPDGFRAATPAQGYSTHFGVEGMTLTVGQSRLKLQLTGVGYGERLTPVAAALPTSSDNRIEYRRGNVTEWYVNGPLGLQQGFTLQERPQPTALAEQSLTLALAIRGGWQAEVSAGGRDLSLTAGDGASLRYGGLIVYDASGQELPARFTLNPDTSIVNILIDDSGAVYPLMIDPFIQQAYLKASNAEAWDNFGSSVAISGETVVVGARYEDSNGTGESDNSASSAGAAYVFVRSGAAWSQQAYLKASNAESFDRFGYSVAISGDTVVVGAYAEASNGTGGESDNSASEAGAAYVYERSGAAWSQQAYLKASNAEAWDNFGYSVAISGDTVVVGARYEASNGTGESDNSAPAAGAAYVFARSGAAWSQQAYLKASNAEAWDYFGYSVAISGDSVVVGASGEASNGTGESDNSASEAGAAYVYLRSGATWSQQAYLKASNAQSYDDFGSSVAISGETVVVGAPYEDSNGTGESDNSARSAGAAYVYERSGAAWSQQAYLKASNAEAWDYFGYSVAIGGDTVVVGAYGEDSNGTGGESDNSASSAGAAYVYARSGATWSQQAYIKASNAESDDCFGYSVAISGDTVVVGAYGEASNGTGESDNSASSAGAAYVFVPVTTGSITVVKQVVGDAPATDWSFSGDLGAFTLPAAGGQQLFTDQAAGDYTITETSKDGYAASVTCDSGESGSNSVTVNLDAGEDVICTFTNSALPGSITVVKQVVGQATATDWSFSGDLGGFTLPAAGGQQLFTDQAAGDYTITETSKDGYAVSVVCNSGESGSNSVTVNLDADETVICTFTNTRQGGAIIVEKQTDPDGAAGSFTFTGHAAGAISDGGQIVVSDLLPGAYTATEADPSPEFELTAITCDDGNSSGNVATRTATFNLEAGETVKCTFTNARRSLKVTKELELPVGGLAAIGQTLRFEIEIFNDGGVDFDSISLTDDFAPWCMTARRASLPPDSGGGGVAPLVWNDLGPLAAGQRLEMWVEFTAAHGCEDATNTAIVTADGLMFEDEASLRILETIARFAGYAFHDDNGSGALEWPCQGADNNPVGCEPGIKGATASLDGLLYTTNTSGWWSFNLLDPGTYHVDLAIPMGGSYWTPTGDTWCDVTIVNTWDQVFCHRGYWWGLDWPPLLGPVADDTMTFHPTQDTFISAWEAGNHGAAQHVQVRQPGYGSTLLEFDRSGLPVDATPLWAKIKLYAPFGSNSTNRLYVTAYPLDKAWVEDEVTWLQAQNGLPWTEAGATGDHGDAVGWAWIGAPGWVEFDLDPTELLANDYGYLLRGEGSENRQVSYWFFSREYVNGDVQPQLVVGYNVP